jgi:DNA-binding CsgD family transcriptional regulator
MGASCRATGLDRLSLAAGGVTVATFLDGTSRVVRHYDGHAGVRPDIPAKLEVRSGVVCRVQADGGARGVVAAASARRDWFTDADRRFLEGAARWMGLVPLRVGPVDRLAQSVAEDDDRRRAEERGRLTRREQEVAALVAEGLTNEAIAERLVLVPGTVSNHVEHILRKLGLARRVQIATWVVRSGLWTPDPRPTG